MRIALLLFLVLVLSFTSCKPRCPIPSCQTRKVHLHSGKEFRGQPWYKKQSPEIGEKLPKQPKETMGNKEHNKKSNYKK